jgi:hypothetical protein
MSTYRPIWYAQADYTPAQIGPAKQSKICVIYTNYPAEYQGNKAKCDARQANPSPKQRSADTT